MIEALTALLVCQLIGELAARTLQLPVPGPVVGLVLWFLFLRLRGSVSDSLRQRALIGIGVTAWVLDGLVDRKPSDAGERDGR